MPKLAQLTSPGSKSVARRFPFSKKLLDGLSLPENEQRAYYYDARVRGLAIAVSPAGRKVFVLYRKVAGRPERITIGPYPDLSIENARDKAEELNGSIARGENPAARRREIRQEATLGDLFDAYLEHHSKRLGKRTWPEDVRRFNLHFHSWRLRKLSSLDKFDVVRLHAHVTRSAGPIAANRAIQMLRRLFNKGKEWGWRGENPAEDIELNREHSRRRFLEADELPAFFRSLSKEPNATIRDYVLVSLLTGARRSNVQSMQWGEINWERATWMIPAAKAKSDEDMTVTLSPVVVQILKARQQNANGCPWVFPGPGRTGHLVEPKRAWQRILSRAGLGDLRLHDLRRTLGSWQVALGTSLPIIGKSLGHKSMAATAVYAQLNLDPVRAAVEKAGDAMLLAGGVAGLLKGGGQ